MNILLIVIGSGMGRLHINAVNNIYFVSAKEKYIAEKKGDKRVQLLHSIRVIKL